MIITSNLPLDAQYIVEQHKKPETYNALLRRINYVEEFLPNGTVKRMKLNDVVSINKKDEGNG
nr:hypothetical protein [uncultured Ruminococcus sp.]